MKKAKRKVKEYGKESDLENDDGDVDVDDDDDDNNNNNNNNNGKIWTMKQMASAKTIPAIFRKD